ncbi:MAG: hypothetical protein WCO68_09120 [Verrucomicrobiota bacterium]
MLKRTPSAPRIRKTASDTFTKARAIPAHPLDWLLEPLEQHPSYLRRQMFGCEAAYLNGRLMLVLAAGEEPWNGLLVATGREFHAALQSQWEQLQPHSVLGKWLYLSQANPAFEEVATAIVEQVRRGDARIGVEPQPRKPKRATS